MNTDPQAPWSLMEVAIEAKSQADRDILCSALAALTADDPSFRVSRDPDSGQTILKGVGELHLDSKIDILRRTYKVDAYIGAPQIAYLETLTRSVEQDYTHKKQTGGTGQFARVKISFEPNEAGAGNLFDSKPLSQAIPMALVRGVEEGIKSALAAGIMVGFPVVDVKATLIDAAFHDVDSSMLSFEIAARTACRGALSKGGAILLEPVMIVEIDTPETYAGSCIGDLKSRRARLLSEVVRGYSRIIQATVPLANLFGYANQLRSFTQGRATFTMRFGRYQPAEHWDGGRPPPAAAAALRA